MFSIMSSILTPGKQKVAAAFLLMFLTIDSPVMSIDRGGAVSGGEIIHVG